MGVFRSQEYFVCNVEHLKPQGSSDIMHEHNNSKESVLLNEMEKRRKMDT
jgi:hypothetical protein